MANERYNGNTGVRVISGVTYGRSITADVEKMLVTVVHVSDCKDGKVYATSNFDFSKTEMADILEMAGKSIVIASRASEFRTRTVDEAIKVNGQTLDPMDYHKRERATGPKDPVKAATKLVKKMSAAERAEMIAMLQAQDN